MQYVDLARSRRPKKSSKLPFIAAFVVVFLLSLGGLLIVSKLAKVAPVTLVTNIVRPKTLQSTNGWTNVLLLGIDARPSGNAMAGERLTDTILVASFNLAEKRTLLTSIPRDLYITEQNTKINSIYTLNYAEDDPTKSMSVIKSTVEKVTGLPLHYYVLIDFQGFIEGVNTLGGLDVDVPQSFDDYYYPVQGMENATCGLDAAAVIQKALDDDFDPAFSFPCRFETLKFTKGVMHMDGALALKYARSRHADGTAGSDYDRAHRQQLVIEAAKEKSLSMQTLSDPLKMQSLYGTFSKYVQTNIDLTDLLPFYNAAKSLAGVKASSVVLSSSADYGVGGGLLVDGFTDGGLWITRPRVADFSEIHTFIQKSLLPPEATVSAGPTNVRIEP